MKLNSKFIRLTKSQRLHGLSVPMIGLTGGIATGKSTVAELLQKSGLAVINADALVKSIYQKRETEEFISKVCPEAWNKRIDFITLRKAFFADESLKSTVERFIYDGLPAAFTEAVGALPPFEVLVYDVPLLFEKKLDALVDLKVVVYAPRSVQRARLMKRDNHLEAMAETILNQQMDIEEKKLKADFVINNSRTLVELAAETDQFLRQTITF